MESISTVRSTGRLRALVCVGIAAVAAAPLLSMAQPAGSKRDLARERFEGLDLIKREAIELVVKMRRQCASGQDPKATARARALGAELSWDSADRCPMVLARVASEGKLLDLYRELLQSLNGAPDLYESLPGAIGAAVMAPSNRVPIGNQRMATVSAALALDAGFTVAYLKGQGPNSEMPRPSVLKAIAERCLGLDEQDLGLCYSTGYIYGARAFGGQALVEPPP